MDWLNEGPGRKSLRRQEREEGIRLCRDVFGGTLQMRKQAGKYLPPFPKEPERVYARRVQASVLFNAYKRTVRGLVGMVLRKAPKPTEAAADEDGEMTGDVDRSGRDLPTFADDLFNEAWIDGHAILFVDKPPVPEGATSDETVGIRPYFIVVRADDVLGAETVRRDGKDVVTSIRWRESKVEKDPADRFKEKLVHRVREYRLSTDRDDRTRVEWEVWELKKEGKDKARRWVSSSSGFLGPQMDEIPLSPVYTNRTGTLDSEPPLLDLAAENVRHFQKLSDKDNIEHLSCVPIFTTIGADEEEIYNFSVGPTVGLALPKGADAKYVEPEGTGSATNRESLNDSERRMALLGLSMLHSDSRAPETATSKRIDKAESDSQLSVAAASLERCLNRGYELYAKWEGGTPLEISVNRDFQQLLMDAQTLQVLGDLVPTKLSLETLWQQMQQGELLPEGFDPELERQRLETEDMEALALLRRAMGGSGEQDDSDDE